MEIKIYLRELRAKRRLMCFKILGNKCNLCGLREDLQFDHKDPNIKHFNISEMLTGNWTKLLKELKKCQLLCYSCHNIKSILEQGKKVAKDNHGTISTYTYCKCEKCKEAARRCKEEYYKTHKRITVNGKRVVVSL